MGRSWVEGGDPNSDLIFIEFGITPLERKLGRPFVGADGRILAAALGSAGVSIKHVRLLKTLDPNMYGFHAKAIILLGKDALEAATGETSIDAWRGYTINPAYFPTFSPHDVMKSGLKFMEYFMRDIEKAVNWSRGSTELWRPPQSTFPNPHSGDTCGIDIETEQNRITEIGLAGDDWASNELGPPELRAAFSSPALKLFHNIYFDLPRLRLEGWELTPPFWDTMLAQQLITPDAPGYTLNETASYWMVMNRWKHLPGKRPRPPKERTWKRTFICGSGCGRESLIGTGTGKSRICMNCTLAMHQAETETWKRAHKEYNRTDAAVLPPIQKAQETALAKLNMLDLFRNIMEVVVDVLIPMQTHGIPVDQDGCGILRTWYTRREELAVRRIRTLTSPDFNPFSSAQVIKLLYTDLGLPAQRRKGVGNVTADEESIRSLAEGTRDPRTKKILYAILRARGSAKLKNEFGATGDRIYPRYAPGTRKTSSGIDEEEKGLAIANTGRILAKGDRDTGTPAPQKLPKRARRIIVPEAGHTLVQADYASQELYIQAALSKEVRLLEALEKGLNIHKLNSHKFGIPRVKAKNMWYGGVAYGGGWKAVQHACQAKGFFITKKEIEEFQEAARHEYPRLFAYHLELLEFARLNHYLRNPFGRVRKFFSVANSRNEILNWPIQSTGADILWNVLKPAFTTALEYEGRLLLTVHDSLVFSVPKQKARAFIDSIDRVLARPWPQLDGLRIPIDITTGQNWGEVS